MVMLDAVVVIGVVGLLVFGALTLLMRPRNQRAAVSPGRWRTVHYEAGGATRVVVQKLSPDGVSLLDEHLVSAVPVDDPDYDQKFLAAMSAARERQALFQSEEGP